MYYKLIENNIDKLNDKMTKNYFSKNNIYLRESMVGVNRYKFILNATLEYDPAEPL